MRTSVVFSLIADLRASGYPGYSSRWNSEAAVKQRMEELYIKKYGEGPFIPKTIQESIEQAHRARLSGGSLIMDKNASPSEPLTNIDAMEASMRPLHLLSARSTQGASTTHFEHAEIFARYQTLEIQTSSTLLDQFDPSYLGCAFPFTLPVAVGG
jgi:hypothetical protein